MKTSKFFGGLGLVLLAVAGVAYAAQFVPGTINVPTALASVNNQTLATTTGTPFDIPQGVAFVIQPDFTAASTGTSNVIFSFNLSTDGTNYSTTYPLTVTNTCNGTTNVIGGTVIPAATLAGYKKGRFDQVSTTQGNAVTINAIRTGFFY